MKKRLKLMTGLNLYQKAAMTIPSAYGLTSVSVMGYTCPKEFKLSGLSPDDREAGGSMLSVTGLNHFIMCVTLPTCVASTTVCCPSSVNGFTGNPVTGMSLLSCREIEG